MKCRTSLAPQGGILPSPIGYAMPVLHCSCLARGNFNNQVCQLFQVITHVFCAPSLLRGLTFRHLVWLLSHLCQRFRVITRASVLFGAPSVLRGLTFRHLVWLPRHHSPCVVRCSLLAPRSDFPSPWYGFRVMSANFSESSLVHSLLPAGSEV